MKLFDGHRPSAKILLLELMFVLPFFITIFGSCAHTVDYDTKQSVDTLVRVDTFHPPGPAFIRFLAILNNGSIISLYPSKTSTTPFASAQSQMTSPYIPVGTDSAFKLFASYHINSVGYLDSVSIPAEKLTPFSLTTIVLFETDGAVDTALFPFFANDSAKKVPAPAGWCYLRLVNGLADFPTPQPAMNIHLDSITGPPLFMNGTNDAPVYYQTVRNYVLVPAGNHNIFATNESDKTQLYTSAQTFESGKYYTARLTGRKQSGTDQFVIDQE
jgi:hypothetical protein